MSRRAVKVTFVGDDQIHEFVKSKSNVKASRTRQGGKRRQVKVYSESSGEESSLSEDEQQHLDLKPTAVCSDEEDGVYGQDVYQFSSTARKSGAMVRKAEALAESTTPKTGDKSRKDQDKDTPKSILKKQSKYSGEAGEAGAGGAGTPTRRSQKVETTTPYRLRARNEAADESSDDSASSSDDQDGGQDGDQDGGQNGGVDDSAKMDVKKQSVTTNKRQVSMKEMVEGYFHMTSDKSVTSDRTLAKLDMPRMDAKSLIQIVSSLPSMYLQERLQLYKLYTAHFNTWMFQLCAGRNILLHGVGSKRPLLDLFRTKLLADHTHLVVNGFFPSLTLKHVLTSVVEELLDVEDASWPVPELQDYIIKHYNNARDEHLFLVINNIDGCMLRPEKVQNSLSLLAEVPNIHLIASVDHINAPLIWDQAKCSRFQWIWYDCTTYEPYSEETSYENSLLVHQSGVLALSSLTHVMRSLTPNAKQIFHLLAHHQLLQTGNNAYIGLSFPDLYQKCREAFLVNSNLTLKAQLTEFRDHKLIKSKKGPDGTEHLSIPLDDNTLKEFMDNKDEH